MEEKNISIIGHEQSPVKTVLRLSLPAILEQIMFTAVTYVDTAMVGVLGKEATAAVGINSSCVWLIGGILSAMGVGFSVQVAQKAGANDLEGARDVVRTAVFTCFFVGIVAGIFTQIIAPYIPIWMGGEPEVIPLAQQYVRIYLMGLPFSILAMVFSPTMRSLGNMKTPMILNITGNLINCVLNFFFIYDTRQVLLFGKEVTIWGAGWGVSGAAFGTAASNTFVGLFMFSAVLLYNNPLKVPLRTCLHPRKNIILRMIGIGTPVAFERAVVASGQIVSTRIVTNLGTLPLAAHHLANTAESISYLPGEGIAYASTTLVGQSIGAGDVEE
ncbi:MAG: MATE family efflux transporter, partial [Clostridiales bacterium]|nr:MATE family efflux transporter [Clostridiales bacterium]